MKARFVHTRFHHSLLWLACVVCAAASVPLFYARGQVDPTLAAAAVLGVLAGSRAGFYFGGRARAKWLKLLMAGVLVAVSLLYFRKAFL